MYKTKSITVDVDVDYEIDLDDFEIDELFSELESRIMKMKRNGLTAKQSKELTSNINDLQRAAGISLGSLSIQSLDDQMKIEHLTRVWNMYPSYVIESRLPA